MVAVARKLAELRKVLDAPLTEEQARDIYRQGEAAVVFALLTLSERLAATQPQVSAPSTPSGMVPPHQKPAKSPGKKRPGRKAGHPGSRRPTPDHIDRQVNHRLAHCPHCSGPLKRCAETRARYTEDIPEGIKPVVTEHTIHRDWCPRCRKIVEPVVPDALPHATLGNRTLAMTSWLHYGLGNTLSQIVDVFTFLDREGVPFENNLAERAVRPAVIIRKNSYCNRSQRGADTQAVLMSVYRTIEQRGHDPLNTLANALYTYLKTGKLSDLPKPLLQVA